MKVLGRTEQGVDQDKDGTKVSKLESVEAALVN